VAEHSVRRWWRAGGRRPVTWVVMLLCALAVAGPVRRASADAIIDWSPHKIHLHFLANGVPYDKPVEFVIRCYGYNPHLEDWTMAELQRLLIEGGESPFIRPDTYVVEETYTLAGSCPESACVVSEYLAGGWARWIDYCDMEITAEGVHLILAQYAHTPFELCPSERTEPDERRLGALYPDYCVRVDLASSVARTPPTPQEARRLAWAARWERFGHWMRTFAGGFPLALALTLVVEAGILTLLMRLITQASSRRVVLVGLLASLLTLPLLWYVLPAFVPRRNYPLVAEGVAVVLESVIYYYALRVSAGRAVALSLVTNVLSYAGGRMVF